jgi:hypothetical protein
MTIIEYYGPNNCQLCRYSFFLGCGYRCTLPCKDDPYSSEITRKFREGYYEFPNKELPSFCPLKEEKQNGKTEQRRKNETGIH